MFVGYDHRWPSAENRSCSSDGWSPKVPGSDSSLQLLPSTHVSLSWFLAVTASVLLNLQVFKNSAFTYDCFIFIHGVEEPFFMAETVQILTSSGQVKAVNQPFRSPFLLALREGLPAFLGLNVVTINKLHCFWQCRSKNTKVLMPAVKIYIEK